MKPIKTSVTVLIILLLTSCVSNTARVPTDRNYFYHGVDAERAGNYRRAITYYDSALIYGLRVFGPGHIKIAFVYNNLGLCHKKLGHYQKALRYYHLSLRILLRKRGRAMRLVAITYNNLGRVYKATGNYRRAVFYASKAVFTAEKAYGEHHHRTRRYRSHLRHLLRSQRR